MKHFTIDELLTHIEFLVLEIQNRIDDPEDAIEYANELSINVDDLVNRLELVTEE